MFTEAQCEQIKKAAESAQKSVNINGVEVIIDYGFDEDGDFYAQVPVKIHSAFFGVIERDTYGDLTHIRMYPELDAKSVSVDDIPVLSNTA